MWRCCRNLHKAISLCSHQNPNCFALNSQEGEKSVHFKALNRFFQMRQHLLHWWLYVTGWLIKAGDLQICMFDSSRTTPLVFYLVGLFVWSVWSPWSAWWVRSPSHSPSHNLHNFQFYLWVDFQSCFVKLRQKLFWSGHVSSSHSFDRIQ